MENTIVFGLSSSEHLAEEICNECFSDFRQNAYLKEAFYLKNENIIKIFNALYEMIEDVPND